MLKPDDNRAYLFNTVNPYLKPKGTQVYSDLTNNNFGLTQLLGRAWAVQQCMYHASRVSCTCFRCTQDTFLLPRQPWLLSVADAVLDTFLDTFFPRNTGKKTENIMTNAASVT